MELHPRDGNKFTTNRLDGAQRSFNPTNQGNFNKVRRPRGYVNRQDSGNNAQSNGREHFKSFLLKYQDGPNPAKWDAQFQAYDIEGKAVLEALKELMAFTILKENGPETVVKKVGSVQPELEGKIFSKTRSKEVKQPRKDQTTTKEIAAAFSAVMGQEISEEEVSLIQGVQLPKEEINDSTEDTEALEVSEGK